MTAHEIRNLLGHDVVLLSWPSGSKGTPKKWGHLTAADMTPPHLRKCDAGNIGVALGQVSGGLIVVDVDDDKLVPAYTAANPSWKGTLRTRGARGCGFWLRMAGDYPTKTITLKTHSGGDAGEWRAGKNSQSIIHGIHPLGHPYQMLNKAKPLVVSFASINWPSEIANPPVFSDVTQRHSNSDTQILSHSVTQDTQVIGCVVGCELSEKLLENLSANFVRDVEHAIQLSMPSQVHQNNRQLFTLARAVKSLEIQSGKFNREMLNNVFTKWHIAAAPYLRSDQSHDEYKMEFMKAYSAAKTPLGDGIINQAWKAAQTKPIPPEAAAAFTDRKFQLIVALCRELQISAGDKPFYLSSRTLARLLEQPNHIAASRYMTALCVMGFIEEETKGTMGRASCYRYTPPTRP